MEFTIIETSVHNRGKLYTLEIREKRILILFLHHALERMTKWCLSEEMVIETLLFPEEVITGHRGRYIAHRRYNDNHLIRAVYEYDEEIPVIVTVYFPYSERYFKGGKIFEDKILKGS
ncbi:MAG TPA: DUF4258 domain-containing protein [Candidatus Atribacteria bacterium]|nr:DUF4258 domain-containing protein [Candidatus Atribacteria bacterium]